MMMLTDPNGGVHAPHNSNTSMSISVTPTAASANANANRRPRAQSMQQHFSEKSSSLGAASPRDCSSSGSFVSKLFRMVDSEPSSIVSWTRGGTAFCIVDPKMMAEHCLPKYFRHRRFSSLIRQLNFYSFYRVQEGQLAIYQHSFFRKGRPDLLVHIKRRGAGKAKDPLFDPLSSLNSSASPNDTSAHSHTNNSHTNAKHSNVTMTNVSGSTSHPSLNLGVIGVNTMNATSGMICYSPMSKPVMMENMSPALKPGMAPTAPPPMVDMGGSLLTAPTDELMMASKQQPQMNQSHQQQQQQQQHQQRWEFAQRESEQHAYPLAAAALQLKHKFMCMESSLQQSPMLRPSDCSVGALPAPLDLDIQDFLTDDCSINAGSSSMVGEMKSELFDDRLCGSSSMNAKHAIVSRDLLKWDGKCETELSSTNGASLLTGTHDDESTGTFEDELLLDLANVEPDAWEVPLSPLNEEEDMMPWLDLCF